MTTTAHEDQFTDAQEPVIQPYDTGSILRRNVADLEIALRKQTERAEKAEAELAKLREQERERCAQLCEWLPVGTGYEGKTFAEAIRGNGLGGKLADGFIPSTFRITEPIPAPAPAVPDVTPSLASLAWERAFAEGDDTGIDFSLRVARHVRALLQSAGGGK